MFNNKRQQKNKGFTLIELMISITLFSAVIVIALGSLMMIINASRKAKTIKTVVNNLHVAVEGMSREIRVGYDYTCGATTKNAIIENGHDCASPQNSDFGFHTKKQGGWALYRLHNNTIQRHLNESEGTGTGRDDGDWVDITTEGIIVDELDFKVTGTEIDDSYQPRVMIRIGAHAKIENFITYFNIQTTVTQRKLSP